MTKENEGASVTRGPRSDTIAALAAWDAGETVWTIEMGGLGPGYEQCIQILVWEIVRDNEPLPEVQFGEVQFGSWGESAVRRCNPGCGFSGAQVGAAKRLAYRFLKNGHRATLDEVEQDRRVLVSKKWPMPPDSGNASAQQTPSKDSRP